jgi:hypothetical protein
MRVQTNLFHGERLPARGVDEGAPGKEQIEFAAKSA